MARSLCGLPLSEAARYDIADEALAISSQRELDTARNPEGYMVAVAWNLGLKYVRVWGKVDLVEDQAVLDAAVERSVRSAGGDVHVEAFDWEMAEDRAPDVFGPSFDQEMTACALEAIEGLTARQTKAVAQLSSKGLSAAEIAKELGIPRNQVDQQWHRAVLRIRAMPEVKKHLRTRLVPGEEKGSTHTDATRSGRNDKVDDGRVRSRAGGYGGSGGLRG
ncbi:RNA polymerase sigma factor [Streptomyces sp. NPDC059083]|uniref:RNA polymerase sigma factor n=1 Tax=unclassified Streptomyces TaxID=2593676 RepID=UPI0036BAB4ED